MAAHTDLDQHRSPPFNHPDDMVDTIKAWQCIGCGKLEADAHE
jgi:hypothetical protein